MKRQVVATARLLQRSMASRYSLPLPSLLRLQPDFNKTTDGFRSRRSILLFGHPYVQCRKGHWLHTDDDRHAFSGGRRSAFFLCYQFFSSHETVVA